MEAGCGRRAGRGGYAKKTGQNRPRYGQIKASKVKVWKRRWDREEAAAKGRARLALARHGSRVGGDQTAVSQDQLVQEFERAARSERRYTRGG